MIDFKSRKIPYFIGEIGINHNGDIGIAKKLIDACYACDWDCVKFQKRNPDKSVPEKQKKIERETPWGRLTYIEYKKRIELGKREYNFIDKYCKDKPLDWSASVWDLDSLEFLSSYDIPFIKIPSAMITNEEIVTEAAKSRKQIIISSGMSTVSEIDKSINILEKFNSKNYVLMHCNSQYPTPKEDLNLRNIEFLKNRYNCVIGYSGHEQDLEPSVIAVVLGAKVIERHITISHDMWGTDQKSSLEVVGMDMLRKRVKDINIMLGKYEKNVTEGEKKIKEKLRG